MHGSGLPWLRKRSAMKRVHFLVMILSAAASILLTFTVAGVACAGQPGPRATVPVTAGPGSFQAGTPDPASLPGEAPVATPTALLEEIIMTRTPEPTATPGRVEQQVEELAETVGLARTTFLGLSVANWANPGHLPTVRAGWLPDRHLADPGTSCLASSAARERNSTTGSWRPSAARSAGWW